MKGLVKVHVKECGVARDLSNMNAQANGIYVIFTDTRFYDELYANIEKLSKNYQKADKGRRVVTMNSDKHKKYTEKYLQILDTNQFVKLNSDPAIATEREREREREREIISNSDTVTYQYAKHLVYILSPLGTSNTL